MGAFSFSIPAGLQAQLAKIANFDEVAPKMINEAMPIYVKAIVRRAPKKTGALKESVAGSKAKKTKTGAYIGTINFHGYDENGTPNALKAAALEYGKKGKQKHPFVFPAYKEAEQEIKGKMQEVFNREVDK